MDSAKGCITLTDRDGTPLLVSSVAVTTGSGASVDLLAKSRNLEISSKHALFDWRGEMLILHGDCPNLGVEFKATINVLHKERGAIYNLEVTNGSTAPLKISSLSPIATSGSQNLGCRFGAKDSGTDVRKALTNGRMYHDPGKLFDFPSEKIRSFDSFCNAALYCPSTSRTLVAGYLDCRTFEPHIVANSADSGSVSLNAQSRSMSELEVAPGHTVSSGNVLVLVNDNPFAALETYADLMAKFHKVHLNPIINGWCTWFPMFGDITEERVMKNAEVIARDLKPYGMDWLQIDDGYQRGFGNWEAQPGKVPNGMKDLARKITQAGLKPGIWVAPFAISKGTEIEQKHPDWLVHQADGSLQPIEQAHQGQAQYILDVSHPDARKWLRDTFHTITHDWGYKFIKTDFSEWTLLATQRFRDPSYTTARGYYEANKSIREGIGADVHFLDCGPTPEIVGLADSMRIELDRPVDGNITLWDQYALHYNSTAPAVAKRYYFHGRTWINDADHIRLAGFALPQARVAATITALSGGNMISGDQLYELDKARMDILQRVLPAYGRAARPLDLFETEYPSLFVHEAESGSAKWTVAGIFNWQDTTRTLTVPLTRLGLDSNKKYLAFDFWAQKLVSDGGDTLIFLQEPRSVTLLSLREVTGTPQIAGTSRHFTQGAVELAKVSWDGKKRELTGHALGAGGVSYEIFVYVPDGYVVRPVTDLSDSVGAQFSAADGSGRLLRRKFTFKDSAPVAWRVGFEKRRE